MSGSRPPKSAASLNVARRNAAHRGSASAPMGRITCLVFGQHHAAWPACGRAERGWVPGCRGHSGQVAGRPAALSSSTSHSCIWSARFASRSAGGLAEIDPDASAGRAVRTLDPSADHIRVQVFMRLLLDVRHERTGRAQICQYGRQGSLKLGALFIGQRPRLPRPSGGALGGLGRLGAQFVPDRGQHLIRSAETASLHGLRAGISRRTWAGTLAPGTLRPQFWFHAADSK